MEIPLSVIGATSAIGLVRRWRHSRAASDATDAPPAPHFLALVTNGAYAPGAVALAQSLALVGSRARLRVIATSKAAEAALLAETDKCGHPRPPIDVVLDVQAGVAGADTVTDTHGSKGAVLAVDAPRRCLFDEKKFGEGWILLDVDMIAVQSPDALLDLLNSKSSDKQTPSSSPPAPPPSLYAAPNFRMKKKAFGPATGNFNAGVMVVPRPSSSDGAELTALVAGAGDDDTEELLLNQMFKGRWGVLPNGFNVPKRVLHHGPGVWRELIEKKELVFLHYMGAKPWMTDLKKRAGADWEAERPSYHTLEKVWWKVRNGELLPDADGSILSALPLEPTPAAAEEAEEKAKHQVQMC